MYINPFYYVLGPILLILGFLGSSLGLTGLILQKKLAKVGVINMYKSIFIIDLVFLSQLMVDLIAVIFGYDVAKFSGITCKMYYHFNYSLAPISPYALVYVSFERFVSINSISKRFFMRCERNQNYYIILVIVFSLIFFSPAYLIFGLDETNECRFVSSKTEVIYSTGDLLIRVIVPGVLMMIASISLTISVISSRRKLKIQRRFQSAEQRNKILIRDINLTITSVMLNLVYLLLTMPLPLGLLFSDFLNNDSWFYAGYFLYYLSFSIDFYVVFISNMMFRNEILKMFRNNPQNQVLNTYRLKNQIKQLK